MMLGFGLGKPAVVVARVRIRIPETRVSNESVASDRPQSHMTERGTHVCG